MGSAKNCRWIQQLIQGFKHLNSHRWLMIIIKFLIPFLIGLYYPNLTLLIEVLILSWELWDSLR